jgi:hypothetical protein
MSNQDVTELITTPAERTCLCEFSFINPQCRQSLLHLRPEELYIVLCSERYGKSRYIHELWRTGNLELLYKSLTRQGRPLEGQEICYPYRNLLESKEFQEDLVFNTAIMLEKEHVPEEECIAFLNDVICLSANARDNQEFEEVPLDLDAIDKKLTQMIADVIETSTQLPE